MNASIAVLFVVGCAAVSLGAGAPARPGPALDDPAFFAALDLTRPDLAPLKAAVDKSDWASAKRGFVQHLKQRTAPLWHFDWRGRPASPTRGPGLKLAEADRYARNELLSCGTWHDFKDRIDWNANPTPNQYHEWTWQLSRHPFWITLGRAYWETGDEKYARAFVSQMTDWVKNQPRPQDSGNRAASTWRTIEAGIRTFSSWPAALMYFLSSPSFDDESVVLMVKSFHDHAQHLMKHPTSGNWLAMEANGLFHIGVLFPEFKEAEAWRRTAIERLYGELDKQVYPDGAQIELAPGYHNVSLDSFEMPARLAQLNGLPLPADYIAKLERMFDYELHVSMPNRKMPGLNDSGDVDITPWMQKAAKYFPHRQDFLWAASGGKEGAPPARRSCALAYAGHLVMRSGWDADARYLLLDAGPFGYGHQHEDKLSVIVAAYGRIHLIDPGNYAYDNSPWRRYHIDTFAHNTVLVDSLPQRRRGAKNRREYVVQQPLPHAFVTTDAWDYASGVYAEGYGQRDNRIATHRREVAFIRSAAPDDYWVIVDTFTPRDGVVHTYDAMFHLNADGIDIDPASRAVRTRNAAGSNLAILPLAEARLSVSNQAGQEKPHVQGWAARGLYGVRPIPTPVYRLEAAGPAKMIFVLYPLKDKATAVPTVKLAAPAAGETVAVELAFAGGQRQRIALREDSQRPVSTGN